MTTVDRRQVLDIAAYELARPEFRRLVLEAKQARRIHLGGCLTLLFENRLTVLYQVQEMMRAERIVRETDILHEIGTYNELLGGPGGLGATLLIEIDDPVERAEKLGRWLGLPSRVYVALDDGTRVHARFDARQVGEERLSAVQYLKFDVKGRVPVAAGVDFAGLAAEVRLADSQRCALAEDLDEDRNGPELTAVGKTDK